MRTRVVTGQRNGEYSNRFNQSLSLSSYNIFIHFPNGECTCALCLFYLLNWGGKFNTFSIGWTVIRVWVLVPLFPSKVEWQNLNYSSQSQSHDWIKFSKSVWVSLGYKSMFFCQLFFFQCLHNFHFDANEKLDKFSICHGFYALLLFSNWISFDIRRIQCVFTIQLPPYSMLFSFTLGFCSFHSRKHCIKWK